MSSKDICQARWYNLCYRTLNCVKIVNNKNEGSNVTSNSVFILTQGREKEGRKGSRERKGRGIIGGRIE